MRASMMLALAALLLPLACRAIPTGLNIMPTAEVLGPTQTRAEFESDGNGKLYNQEHKSILGSQSGFVLGFEGGVDNVSGDKTVYNVKWAFKGEGLVFPALAVGAQNITSGEKPQYYAVATKSLLPNRIFQVSAGAIRVEGDNLLMYGARGRIGMLELKADRVQGGGQDRNAISAGIIIKKVVITGTLYDYENQDDERTITVSYTQGLF